MTVASTFPRVRAFNHIAFMIRHSLLGTIMLACSVFATGCGETVESNDGGGSGGSSGISEVYVTTVGTDRATIHWTTSASSTSQVEYGRDLSYGTITPEDTTLTRNHAVELTGLNDGTYHFRVTSTNEFAQTLVSSDRSFTFGVLYYNSFESGSPEFGFEGLYDLRLGNYYTLGAVTGWNGTQGAHLITRANRTQYNSGWFLHNGILKPGGWQNGNIIYVRLRMRFDDDFRWDGDGSMQNKMVDFGIGGNGSSRVILHQEAPNSSTPCSLAITERPNFGSFAVKKGITDVCTPPVRITYGVWYHVQFAVLASNGTTQDGYFKLWVNNNDIGAPSSERLNIAIPTSNGGTNYWNGSLGFGGYISERPIRDQGWIFDDFQISDAFDANWYPG